MLLEHRNNFAALAWIGSDRRFLVSDPGRFHIRRGARRQNYVHKRNSQRALGTVAGRRYPFVYLINN